MIIGLVPKLSTSAVFPYKLLAPTIMMALAFLYCLIPLVSAASWKENRLSLNIDRGGNLNDCVTCHLRPQTNHELVVPITDFDTVPDPTTYYNHPPLGVTWQVQLTKEYHNIPVPCFNLSEIISIGGKVTTGPPRSLKFILKKCDEQNPLKCTIDKCVKSKNDTNLCQRAKQVGYHVNGLWKACSGSHPWLDNIISELPKNERINDTTLGGITCSPPGYIFVCGTGSDSPTRGWAYRCLDSWQMEGSCLLGRSVTFSGHSVKSITSLSNSKMRLRRQISSGY